MAVKKSELYSSLWNSCDELRGGMDASLYKDYVLTLLFVKYVTDRFMGDRYAEIEIPVGGSFKDMIDVKGKSDIGDRMNKIISKLAEANGLTGIIDVADFDDDSKLGSGKDKVDKLTNLVSIFQNESLDFRKNRAGGDDIIGDAYEYMMKNFASESGKSKGQFYTPAEVSRIMAKVIGISTATMASQTLYDPACGSGSLLIRAADEAPNGITIYGQEYDNTTAGLAKMNLVLHNKSTGTIANANTLSNPKFKNGDKIERFDFAVANPPFSYKSWANGIDTGSDERFIEYSAAPPEKNGDYAWLIHFIHSLKPRKGKGAIILPHGVLFRGNAEATIRREIIEKRIIKGIIGLPANLFYGTGIPACIIVIDKENAQARQGLFMIDASKGFIKDGNKNRLREQDIRKIVDSFNGLLEVPKYSRMIPYSEIQANDYNLNIPRYIDSSEPEDLQDISAHLYGGIPQRDIDILEPYWKVFLSLRTELFKDNSRDGYMELKVNKDNIRETIYHHPEFTGYAESIKKAFEVWKTDNWTKLNEIMSGEQHKQFIEDISKSLLDKYNKISLIDKYDVYQCLMSYWEETMQDDVYAIVFDGWESGRDIEREMVKKKDGTITGKMKSFEGRVIPKTLMIERYFRKEQKAIDQLEGELEEIVAQMEEMKEEHGGEEGLLAEVINDKGSITKGELQKRIKEIKDEKEAAEELKILQQYEKLMIKESKLTSDIKDAVSSLDKLVYDQYEKLSIKEIKDLVVERKWCRTIYGGIDNIYSAISHNLTNRIIELVERYEETLPQIEEEVDSYEAKVKSHLERMGFPWK
ncbi:MAG: type I restriction-modification system subunit M [Clostridiaceae bacterium]|nr:type I restriction-modification system subunit M [Clostridiaceae bacterium]